MYTVEFGFRLGNELESKLVLFEQLTESGKNILNITLNTDLSFTIDYYTGRLITNPGLCPIKKNIFFSLVYRSISQDILLYIDGGLISRSLINLDNSDPFEKMLNGKVNIVKGGFIGEIREFRLMYALATQSTILEWYNKTLNETHPNISKLVIYLPLKSGLLPGLPFYSNIQGSLTEQNSNVFFCENVNEKYYLGYWNKRNDTTYGDDIQEIINPSALTHIILPFVELIDSQGSLEYEITKERVDEIKNIMKNIDVNIKANPDILFLGDFGGWLGSEFIGAVCSEPVIRDQLIKNLLSQMEYFEYDGIEIDWESYGGSPPSLNNGAVEFYNSLGEKVRSAGKHFYVATKYIGDRTEVARLSQQNVDGFLLMSYGNVNDIEPNHNGGDVIKVYTDKFEEGGIIKSKIYPGIAIHGFPVGDKSKAYLYREIWETTTISRNKELNPDFDVFPNDNFDLVHYTGLTSAQNENKKMIENDYGGLMYFSLGADLPDSEIETSLHSHTRD
jgi:hypothetical protein